ncbi:MAG TPA: response regulator [Terracidiphilus sp.]|nr:response regulator [Terracidiphilus sp.]
MHDLITQRELPTVLLIDDDLVSREVAATMLTLSGYTVYTAEDGEGALGKVGIKSGCNPSVILMDTQMPGLSGMELIRELRARTKALVIAISGSEAGEEVTRAADGFLLKPFDAASLENLLEKRGAVPASASRSRARIDDADPVVSPETLAQLRSLMPEEGIREVYSAVAADLERRISELETAIAGQDIPAVRRIGHAIKGGCGMAGALQAARLGAMLEALPDDVIGNQLDNSAKLLDNLRSAARNLERILTSELPV